jgi:ECF sigma factor
MNTQQRLATEDFTSLLQAWSGGGASALDQLTPIVYPELQRPSHLHMMGKRQDRVLLLSALIHEVFVRLMGRGGVAWASHYHARARFMGQILVDFARAKGTRLNQLERLNQRRAKVVSDLGISGRAVICEGRLTRAFLFRSLGSSPDAAP